MQDIVEAIEAPNALPRDYAGLSVPDHYLGVTLHRDDADMFAGMATAEKDPAKPMRLRPVQTPQPGPDEVLVAVMASGINYNTVWSAMFEPVPNFAFLRRYAAAVPSAAHHDQDHHVLGSDMSGVVLRVGAAVHSAAPGDRVVAHCLSVGLGSPDGHDDAMLDPEQRIWGYETNYGGLAQLALVKANQLMPKPEHLTWEEAASSGLVNSTAYRQLVSRNGARMKQGDVVLIWGAAGGLGAYATQLALHGGAIPVCVVSSPEKANLLRGTGAELIIDRSQEDFRFWADGEPDPRQWKRFGARIRDLTGGEDPDIVFEHPGRETFGASVFVARRGGTIVTCASTTGFSHAYDNRYLWMSLKRIIGTHFANYREAWQADRLITKGRIHPALSAVYPLSDAGRAASEVQANRHVGKVGVLALAPEAGLGVRDPEMRARLLPQITRFQQNSV